VTILHIALTGTERTASGKTASWLDQSWTLYPKPGSISAGAFRQERDKFCPRACEAWPLMGPPSLVEIRYGRAPVPGQVPRIALISARA
jgi:hypothetical protein